MYLLPYTTAQGPIMKPAWIHAHINGAKKTRNLDNEKIQKFRCNNNNSWDIYKCKYKNTQNYCHVLSDYRRHLELLHR
jgi:hypothetical protein